MLFCYVGETNIEVIHEHGDGKLKYTLGKYEPRHDKTNKVTLRPAKPHEETLGPQLPIERTAKTLIRLGRCPV